MQNELSIKELHKLFTERFQGMNVSITYDSEICNSYILFHEIQLYKDCNEKYTFAELDEDDAPYHSISFNYNCIETIIMYDYIESADITIYMVDDTQIRILIEQ